MNEVLWVNYAWMYFIPVCLFIIWIIMSDIYCWWNRIEGAEWDENFRMFVGFLLFIWPICLVIGSLAIIMHFIMKGLNHIRDRLNPE